MRLLVSRQLSLCPPPGMQGHQDRPLLASGSQTPSSPPSHSQTVATYSAGGTRSAWPRSSGTLCPAGARGRQREGRLASPQEISGRQELGMGEGAFTKMQGAGPALASCLLESSPGRDPSGWPTPAGSSCLAQREGSFLPGIELVTFCVPERCSCSDLIPGYLVIIWACPPHSFGGTLT